jgi:hypothetical protein
VQDPEIPGPGKYDLKTFVEIKALENKSFTLGRKEFYEFRKHFPILDNYHQ